MIWVSRDLPKNRKGKLLHHAHTSATESEFDEFIGKIKRIFVPATTGVTATANKEDDEKEDTSTEVEKEKDKKKQEKENKSSKRTREVSENENENENENRGEKSNDTKQL